MQVKDVMTPDPACCTPDTTLRRVAEMMVEHDCGEIPVVEDMASMRPVCCPPRPPAVCIACDDCCLPPFWPSPCCCRCPFAS